ncbi:FAD-dependent monooxygenase OpS4 [Colletotrichum spaethianum]|uniref:FAD-dependent monooxygenase OpS4 n=1 Tax=Colletotrichum spaethianum TaxID=700344 RepID=A0AA37L7K9_9PEZI|nr:FAD-dependent monooxygenase OpS4 [Colletotrichum spaethianum]GKT43292.1 FAD-dependent monooxygenase OpS4 [Colletotrichum spaethianum]
METPQDEYSFTYRRAVKPRNVIIIGAGVAGLSAGIALAQTGHSVTILERVPKISEAGAGLQLAPNATRILQRLGVLEEVMQHISVLSRVSIRRYDSDDELGSTPLMPSIGLRYGAPMGVIHRGDLQCVLLKAALQAGCRIRTSQVVVGVHPLFLPWVQVKDLRTNDFSWVIGNIVIAADGINSTVRKQLARVTGNIDLPLPAGDAAYRLLIPREKVKHDKTLLDMLDQNVAVRYMGPGGHVMAYPVKRNTAYNLVLLHPAKNAAQRDANTEDVWSTTGNRKAMLDFYKGWSPAIQAWLSHAEEGILEWTLDTYPAMPRWVRGSVGLVGDACHPMLPYVAQGAANAIEDAAVLAAALTCTSNVPLALRAYEAVRKERAEKIAASAASTGQSLHLADGEEQRKRDDAIRKAIVGDDRADRWCDNEWQDYMWANDVVKYTIENWTELAAKVEVEQSPAPDYNGSITEPIMKL